MKPVSRQALVFLLAFIFSLLFYRYSPGINLLLFNLCLAGAVFLVHKEKLKTPLVPILLGGTLLSALMVALHNSSWSLLMYTASFILLGGALAAPKLRSIVSVIIASVLNFFFSLMSSVKKPAVPGLKHGSQWLFRLKLSLIPLGIIFVFGSLYSMASPWFAEYWDTLLDQLGSLMDMIGPHWFFSFILGLIICTYLLFAKSNADTANMEDDSTDTLIRKRNRYQPYRGRILGLQHEKLMSLITFIALNLMLLGQNILDIKHVWIGFDWSGEELKGFVHEGTYILILSIILSAGLVIYTFRGNLNFLKEAQPLRWLCYGWLIQNAFLAASVGMRCYWYIQSFNLAYKRIGVCFFLIAVLYGLYTIYRKVRHGKSSYYLIRSNALAAYFIMLSIGLFNWDVIIARYNMSHADQAYLHLSFMAKLSNQAIPYLIDSDYDLSKAKQDWATRYGEERGVMSTEDFQEHMQRRARLFASRYEHQDWREWNYGQWKAYQRLPERFKNQNK